MNIVIKVVSISPRLYVKLPSCMSGTLLQGYDQQGKFSSKKRQYWDFFVKKKKKGCLYSNMINQMSKDSAWPGELFNHTMAYHR